MFPVELLAGRLGDDERRLRAAFGWMSGLDPSLLAWDTGLDAVGNLNGALTDDGQHAWEVIRGAFDRTGGNIRTSGSGSLALDNRAAVIDVGIADVLVAVDLVSSHESAGRDHGLVLRASQGGWLIVFVAMSGTQILDRIRLEKFDTESGTRTQLLSVLFPEVNRFTPVRLFAQTRGNVITAGINGIPLLQYTLSGGDESIYTGTKVGLGTRDSALSSAIWTWRNFAVWRAALQ